MYFEASSSECVLDIFKCLRRLNSDNETVMPFVSSLFPFPNEGGRNN